MPDNIEQAEEKELMLRAYGEQYLLDESYGFRAQYWKLVKKGKDIK